MTAKRFSKRAGDVLAPLGLVATLMLPPAAQAGPPADGEMQLSEARSFGLGPNLTVVSAQSFVPSSGNVVAYFFEATGRGIVQSDPDFGVPFVAPLSLPNGAVIESLCLIAEDLDTEGHVFMALTINEFDPLPSTLLGPGVLTSHSGAPGWTKECASDLSIPFRSLADLDEDGVPGILTYELLVNLTSGNSVKRFAAIVVGWRRTVSPTPGTATFDDVPSAHPFFRHVEALAASGITAGCGGGSFCPNTPLTRGQMAVFLAKALGLYWPD